MFNRRLMRARRQELKLSQAELGHVTRIAQSDISDYERGVNSPGKIRRKRLADALRCPELTADVHIELTSCPSCGYRLG